MMRYGATAEGGGMSGGRDPAVKLFGREIPLPEESPLADKGVVGDLAPAAVPLTKGKDSLEKDKSNTEVDSMLAASKEQVRQQLLHSSALNDHIKDDITKETEDSKSEQDTKETATSGEEKLFRKPDKLLPCPRCNSLDTKFCYYNNYNVNQPRYFCKNCQRYWTSGGTMRNVPIGAGRRKNKHTALSYPHTAQPEATDLIHPQASSGSNAIKPVSKVNGTVLQFGSEEEKKDEEVSCSSSVTAGKQSENEQADVTDQTSFNKYQIGVAAPLQCFPMPSWAYTWNPGWNEVASMAWCQPHLLSVPAFCAPIPVPFAPASFWGWAPSWSNKPWSAPLIGNTTLGKHCRDANSSMGEGKQEKSLWVPKSLRIDDIDDAAKSSIFSILGIKPDEDGLFRAFSSSLKRGDAALRANPAALSRSQAFLETS